MIERVEWRRCRWWDASRQISRTWMHLQAVKDSGSATAKRGAVWLPHLLDKWLRTLQCRSPSPNEEPRLNADCFFLHFHPHHHDHTIICAQFIRCTTPKYRRLQSVSSCHSVRSHREPIHPSYQYSPSTTTGPDPPTRRLDSSGSLPDLQRRRCTNVYEICQVRKGKCPCGD